MSGASLRAGLVGLGSMGRNHARVLSSLAGVRFVAAADPAGDLTGAAGSAAVVATVDELIAIGIDYCVVAAPTSDHELIGRQLAESGIAALIEKPVADDVAAGLRLVEAFERAGLVGAVGHIERYNPAIQQLKRRLTNGELGEIFQVATRRQGPFPARIADAGVIMDLATHDIDLTEWVTGQPFVSISAKTAHKSGRHFEDLVAATGQLGDGTITNHLVNWLSPMKERTTVVTGDKGTFVADTLTGDLTFHANGTLALDWQDVVHFRGMTEGDVVRYAFPKYEPLRTEHETFRSAVAGLDGDIITLRQGLSAVRVGAAMLASAASGKTIALDDW